MREASCRMSDWTPETQSLAVQAYPRHTVTCRVPDPPVPVAPLYLLSTI